jgi:hypothetical protein
MSLLKDRQPTEDFLDLYIKLDDRQRKKVYQAVMKDRTENIQDIVQNKTVGSILGGGANISERIMSGLSGGGFDKIPVFKGTRAEETFINAAKKELSKTLNREGKYMGGMLEDDNSRIGYAVGSLLQDDMAMMEEDMPMEETHTMPDGTVMPGATHGEPEEDMAPDEEMEKEFLDFILDEALSPEEEEMLMSRLEQDEELAMLFDKVIDVAQEFAGSGPVEGPGSGVSDSIPARLSDGEFVFTAAAVEEIGADNLMAMMKEAEAAVAERQGLAEGGMPEEEETVTMEVQKQKEPNVQIAKATVNNTRGLLDEDEISKGIKSKMMLDPLQKHVRS